MIEYPVPLLGFCAHSGTGKTTLLRQLLPLLGRQGLAVGVIKHAHHSFDIDRPGKDSYELRAAGAEQVLVASRTRMALVREIPEERGEPSLQEVLHCLDPSALDLVLVEGYKQAPFPKIELHRGRLGKPLLHPHDRHIVAVATDIPLPTTLPRLDINRPAEIARFILRHIAQHRNSPHADTHHPHRSQLR